VQQSPPNIRSRKGALSLGALGSRLLVDATMRSAAATFFRLADAAGVRAAPIKGLVVGPELYDNGFERPFGDVDVLVAWRDLGRLVATARRAGLELVYDSKQLGCVNIIVPPGIAMDVRSTIAPPMMSSESAESVLRRAVREHDPRICDAPILLLDRQDHLLLLVMDAWMDKLTIGRDRHLLDLELALESWMRSPREFAAVAHRAGLAAAASAVFTWVARETGSAVAREAVAALEPLPLLAGLVGATLEARVLPRAPHAAASRLGIRVTADRPLRAVASLALGALGAGRYAIRHGSSSPWRGQLWRGAP
jgi:hypothetical protein